MIALCFSANQCQEILELDDLLDNYSSGIVVIFHTPTVAIEVLTADRGQTVTRALTHLKFRLSSAGYRFG